MNINKKFAIFIVWIVAVPLFLLWVASGVYLQHQVRDQEEKYLQSTLAIARSEMQERQKYLEKACYCYAEDENFQAAVQQEDVGRLTNIVQLLCKNYTKVDYATIVNSSNRVVVSSSSGLNYPTQGIISSLTVESMDKKKTIRTTEVVHLEELFRRDSAEYKDFSAKLQAGISGQGETLRRALAEITTVPIVQKDTGKVLGSIVIAGIANSDYYFPEYVASKATEGFLVLTVDGVRVATKSTVGEEKNWLVGTKPTTNLMLKSDKAGHFFGIMNIKGVDYVFADEVITNHSGKEVGYISLGIEEQRFSNIVNDNRMIILTVLFVCLVMMLIIGRVFSLSIIRPIVAVTNLAKAYSKKHFGIIPAGQGNSEDESDILLGTFKEFIKTLRKAEQDRENYLRKLEEEHQKEQALMVELQNTNETLEIKVQERTQHLETIVAQLKKLDITKSRFLASLSHELRTPLSVIINSADILSAKYFGPLTEKQNKCVVSIDDCGRHLLGMINNLLDVSKMASGKMTLNMQEFSIAPVVKEIMENCSKLAGTKELNMTAEIVPEDFVLTADVERLKQIFYNLLSNAVKFTDDGGTVSMHVFKRADRMEVLVRDTGIGIAPENQERIFQEFEQVDNSYGRKYGGTGLGLPIIKQLVELHGGEVFLKSELGKGTEVIFTIPLTPAKPKTRVIGG